MSADVPLLESSGMVMNPGKKENLEPDGEPDALQMDVQVKLGEKLKEVYSDVVNEPVPDRFVELLNKLDESGK